MPRRLSSSSLPLQGIALHGELPPASDGHPWNIPAVRSLQRRLDLTARITFIVGENGCGKSTLVEAIAVASGFNAEGGSRNFTFATRASHSPLHARLELVRSTSRARNGFFLRAESFFNVISAIEAMDAEPAPSPKIMPAFTGTHDGSSLHERSHGESFFDLLMNRFGPNGLYLLDEPESALSAHRQLAALRRCHDLAAAGSQFIIATHSPLLLAYPQAQILVLDERGITPTPYEEVPLIWLYRTALANPRAVMGELLADDAGDGRAGSQPALGAMPDGRGTGA